jgi:gamma-butyrobetaine dioxygenase
VSLTDAELVRVLEAMAKLPSGTGGMDLRLHCLQAAWLARRAGADDVLVLAAALHDVGPVAALRPDRARLPHELAGAAFAAAHLGDRAAAMIALHVSAKRFLVATDPGYRDRLGRAAVECVTAQGGPMNPTEVTWFRNHPAHRDAVRLRRWDDAARIPTGAALTPAELLAIHARALRAVPVR